MKEIDLSSILILRLRGEVTKETAYRKTENEDMISKSNQEKQIRT